MLVNDSIVCIKTIFKNIIGGIEIFSTSGAVMLNQTFLRALCSL